MMVEIAVRDATKCIARPAQLAVPLLFNRVSGTPATMAAPTGEEYRRAAVSIWAERDFDYTIPGVEQRRQLRREPNDHNFGSLLMLAVTAGAFLVAT